MFICLKTKGSTTLAPISLYYNWKSIRFSYFHSLSPNALSISFHNLIDTKSDLLETSYSNLLSLFLRVYTGNYFRFKIIKLFTDNLQNSEKLNIRYFSLMPIHKTNVFFFFFLAWTWSFKRFNSFPNVGTSCMDPKQISSLCEFYKFEFSGGRQVRTPPSTIFVTNLSCARF